VKSKGISAPNTKFHNYTTLLTTVRAKKKTNNKSNTEFGTNKNVINIEVLLSTPSECPSKYWKLENCYNT
jgi:hypothetical protein